MSHQSKDQNIRESKGVLEGVSWFWILVVVAVALIGFGLFRSSGKKDQVEKSPQLHQVAKKEPDCFTVKTLKDEVRREYTPVEITEEELPMYGDIDALGKVLMWFPVPGSNGKKYFSCPYEGFGKDVNFEARCGPRGHGPIKITSNTRGREVEVVLSRWVKVRKPCEGLTKI